MNCPTCQAILETGQRFCIKCGANVAALTLPVPPAGPLPTAPPTQPLPPPPAATTAFAIVEQTLHPTVDPGRPVADAARARTLIETPPEAPLETPLGPPPGVPFEAPPGPVTEAVPYPAGYVPPAAALPVGRGSTVLAVFGVLAGVAAIVAVVMPILRIRTDAPIADAGVYKINDLYLGTNLLVAMLVAGLCMIGGSVLAVLGRRIGAGLAAGAAISLVPVVLTMYGGVDQISQRAEERAFAVAAAGGGGTFFQTRLEAGLWILVGAAAVGVVVLVVSLLQAGRDARPSLNALVGVAGAVASVVAVVGQMIPGNSTTFADNFDTTINSSRTVIAGRLALIAVVAISGIIGFLRNNRWGIGLALGGAAIWIWQWLSSLTESGETPAPPGFIAFGGDGGPHPHIVTTIGVVAVVVLATVALLAPKRQH